jgi:hypothetical protein
MDAGAKPQGAATEPQDFYADAVTRAERRQLRDARSIQGLEQEIAVLRVRLKAAVREHPEDLRLLVYGIQVLVRAVAAEYRLSPKARADLADSLAAVLNSFGDQVLPADG